MPVGVDDNEDGGDVDDDDLVGDAEDLMSPPISDAEDAFVDSGSDDDDDDDDTPTAVDGENGDKSDNDDEFSDAEASDDLELIDYDTPDSIAEDWTGIEGSFDVAADNKRKRGNDGAPYRRKKRRSLPTFASYEEYARMIEDGPEDYL